MTISLDKLPIQYLTDAKGQQTEVRIPIKEWRSFLEEIERATAYFKLREELKTAFEEVRDMKNGLIPKRSLKDFLDEN